LGCSCGRTARGDWDASWNEATEDTSVAVGGVLCEEMVAAKGDVWSMDAFCVARTASCDAGLDSLGAGTGDVMARRKRGRR